MGSIENILLLNFAILICSVKAITLCEVEVNVTHGTVATQGEPFNITLTFNGVVKQQSFSLTPEWDRLFINQSKIQLIEDSTVDIQMFSNQFYLYKVFISCVENKNGVEGKLYYTLRGIYDCVWACVNDKCCFLSISNVQEA